MTRADGAEDKKAVGQDGELTDSEQAVSGADGVTDIAGSSGADIDAAKEGHTEGREAPVVSDRPEWVTDDVRSLAATYGLSDEDLLGFGDQGQFLRFASTVDRQYRSAKKADTPSGPPAAQPAVEPPAADKPKATQPAEAGFDPEVLAATGHSEEAVQLGRFVAQLHQTLESERAARAALEERLSGVVPFLENQRAREHNRYLAEFHAAVDGLGHYGKRATMTAEENARRRQIWEAHATLAQSQEERGEEVSDVATLVRRAELMAFGDEVLQRVQADRNGKIVKQSAKRRPVGRATAQPKGVLPGDADDPVQAILNLPEMQELLRDIKV